MLDNAKFMHLNAIAIFHNASCMYHMAVSYIIISVMHHSISVMHHKANMHQNVKVMRANLIIHYNVNVMIIMACINNANDMLHYVKGMLHNASVMQHNVKIYTTECLPCIIMPVTSSLTRNAYLFFETYFHTENRKVHYQTAYTWKFCSLNPNVHRISEEQHWQGQPCLVDMFLVI